MKATRVAWPAPMAVLFLTVLLLLVPITSAAETWWTVTESDRTEGDCSDLGIFIEDDPGKWDMVSISAGKVEVPVAAYVVLPGEVYTQITCDHRVVFESSPFYVTGDAATVDIRYRDTSGLSIILAVDDTHFEVINEPWDSEDCWGRSQDVVHRRNIPLPGVVHDGEPHTLRMTVLDGDGHCNDMAQVWLPTRVQEHRGAPPAEEIETIKGLGVDTSRQGLWDTIKGFFAEALASFSGDGDDEDVVISGWVGTAWGPVPEGVPRVPDGGAGAAGTRAPGGNATTEDGAAPPPKPTAPPLDVPEPVVEDEVPVANRTWVEVDRCTGEERTLSLDDLDESYFDVGPDPPNSHAVQLTHDCRKVVKVVDVYGRERYTVDGKRYYDDFGDAAAGNPIRGVWHWGQDRLSDIGDWFSKTKEGTPDQRLMRDVASEVLKEHRKEDAEQVAKDHERWREQVNKLAKAGAGEVLDAEVIPALKVMGKELAGSTTMVDLAAVPADSIITLNQALQEDEFQETALLYLEERQEGATMDELYNDPISRDYLTTSLKGSVGAEFPDALLFAKLEESYQRFLTAKELGRT